jgi:LacI family transcriptional regulator
MARDAVKLLLEEIRRKRAGEAPAVHHKLAEFTIVPRESTSRLSAQPAARKRPLRA